MNIHLKSKVKQISSNLLSNHTTQLNHTQSVERAVKLTTTTTTTSKRVACSKRQIGETLCTIAGKKKQLIENNTTSQQKLLMPVNKIKAIIAICIAFTVFYLQNIISCQQ